MSLTIQEKKSLIKNLIDLAAIDGVKNQDEMQFIRALADQAKIDGNELLELENSNIEFAPPQNEFDRIEHMHKLMLLMATDQTFSVIEKEFIQMVVNLNLASGYTSFRNQFLPYLKIRASLTRPREI